jgi:hypothetical protein
MGLGLTCFVTIFATGKGALGGLAVILSWGGGGAGLDLLRGVGGNSELRGEEGAGLDLFRGHFCHWALEGVGFHPELRGRGEGWDRPV